MPATFRGVDSATRINAADTLCPKPNDVTRRVAENTALFVMI